MEETFSSLVSPQILFPRLRVPPGASEGPKKQRSRRERRAEASSCRASTAPPVWGQRSDEKVDQGEQEEDEADVRTQKACSVLLDGAVGFGGERRTHSSHPCSTSLQQLTLASLRFTSDNFITSGTIIIISKTHPNKNIKNGSNLRKPPRTTRFGFGFCPAGVVAAADGLFRRLKTINRKSAGIKKSAKEGGATFRKLSAALRFGRATCGPRAAGLTHLFYGR